MTHRIAFFGSNELMMCSIASSSSARIWYLDARWKIESALAGGGGVVGWACGSGGELADVEVPVVEVVVARV